MATGLVRQPAPLPPTTVWGGLPAHATLAVTEEPADGSADQECDGERGQHVVVTREQDRDRQYPDRDQSESRFFQIPPHEQDGGDNRDDRPREVSDNP